MLKGRLIHPELIAALAKMGHGSKVMLADGNYPVDVLGTLHAQRIYLNFTPGKLTVTEILDVLLDTLPIEKAQMMFMDNGDKPSIGEDFRRMLPDDVSIEALPRQEFYDAVCDPKTSVIIATGEQRLFANLLLTVGFMRPDGTPQY